MESDIVNTPPGAINHLQEKWHELNSLHNKPNEATLLFKTQWFFSKKFKFDIY